MKKNYSDKLKNPKWQKKRLEIMQRDGFACKYCGDAESPLNVHHFEYGKEPWDVEDKALITLCERCHILIHSFGPTEIIDEGVLSPYDFILLDPMMILAGLSLIENHKGNWTIEFREKANPYHIINIPFLLFDFISGVDCNIDIKYVIPEPPFFISNIEMFDTLKNFRDHE